MKTNAAVLRESSTFIPGTLTHIGYQQVRELIARRIRSKARPDRPLEILEAGCGRKWPFDLGDIRYTLTGVDLDPDALDARQRIRRDLHRAVLGDLRNLDLPPCSFDVVYSSFVLEHVDGAQSVLDNFARWLKPGGLLIIQLPNRDSVFGFFTRITPLSLHVLYKRYVEHKPNAGKPGHEPYPTFYDKAISRTALHEFAAENRLRIHDEYSSGKKARFALALMSVVEWISLRKLSARHLSLVYVMERR